MTEAQEDHEFMELMHHEHNLLEQLLVNIRAELDREPASRKQIVPLLSELADLAEAHFAHEEEGGFMQEAIARAPRLAVRAEAIRREHEHLLEAVQKLHILASSGVESDGWWNTVRTDFTAFADRMFVHEAKEKAIVQEAFTDDLGEGD